MDTTSNQLVNHQATWAARWPQNAPGPAFDHIKRFMDILFSLAGIAVSIPILAVSALWIRLIDGGPVFYKQWRVGHDGWLFRLYKLRTMKRDAESDGRARFSHGGDPRILPCCLWMRKSHVDELPQFWNILKGQMSLVGPRPERPEIVEALRHSMPKIEQRLSAKPGLTGLAQVRNGYTNDLRGSRQKLAYDLRYLRRRSLWREFGILFTTIPKIWDQTAL